MGAIGNFWGDDQVTGWLWRSVALEAIGNFGGDDQVTGWLWFGLWIGNFGGDDQVTGWLWFGLGLGIGNWNYGIGIMGLAMGHLWNSVTFGVTATSVTIKEIW
jgi:hypothetical protein